VFPTSQPSREILALAGQQNKRAIAVTNQQWLARARPPEFRSNHALVWLMIRYSSDRPTAVPVRARFAETLIADIAARPDMSEDRRAGFSLTRDLAIEVAG
jgi:hypothetical protein